jgi:flagellar hook-length control protein FliK
MIVAGAPQVSSPSVQQADPASTLAAPEAGETDFAALLFFMIGTSQPADNPSPAGSGDNAEAADAMLISDTDAESDLAAADCTATQPSNLPDPAQPLALGAPSVLLQGSAVGTSEDPVAGSSLPGSAMPRDISGLQLSSLPVSKPATLSDEAEHASPASGEEKAPAQTAENEIVDSDSSLDAQSPQIGEDKLASTKQFQPGSSPVHTPGRKEPAAVPHRPSTEVNKNSDGAAAGASTEAAAAAQVVSPEASSGQPARSTTSGIRSVEGANQIGRSLSDRERGAASEDTPGFHFAGQPEAGSPRRAEAAEFGSGVLTGEHKQAEPWEIKREPSFRVSDTAVSMLNTTGPKSSADTQTVGAREWRPVIGRVATEIAAQLRISQNEAVIQLDPPDLGKIKIDLHVRGDKLQAHIIAEAQESHALIENHLQELRQALQVQSVDLIDVRVSHGDVTGGGDPMAGFRQQSNGGQETSWTSANSAAAASESSEPRRQDGTRRESGRVSVWA